MVLYRSQSLNHLPSHVGIQGSSLPNKQEGRFTSSSSLHTCKNPPQTFEKNVPLPWSEKKIEAEQSITPKICEQLMGFRKDKIGVTDSLESEQRVNQKFADQSLEQFKNLQQSSPSGFSTVLNQLNTLSSLDLQTRQKLTG